MWCPKSRSTKTQSSSRKEDWTSTSTSCGKANSKSERRFTPTFRRVTIALNSSYRGSLRREASEESSTRRSTTWHINEVSQTALNVIKTRISSHWQKGKSLERRDSSKYLRNESTISAINRRRINLVLLVMTIRMRLVHHSRSSVYQPLANFISYQTTNSIIWLRKTFKLRKHSLQTTGQNKSSCTLKRTTCT